MAFASRGIISPATKVAFGRCMKRSLECVAALFRRVELTALFRWLDKTAWDEPSGVPCRACIIEDGWLAEGPSPT